MNIVIGFRSTPLASFLMDVNKTLKEKRWNVTLIVAALALLAAALSVPGALRDAFDREGGEKVHLRLLFSLWSSG